MLRDAGAVLIAKLATGELAGGDQWFGGQTKNPWDPTQGSSGSSAGPSSATAAGCVAFGIGTETSGSILSPSARCGLAGLRPTFGRVSRYGVMALSWTQDRLGPICRYAEDCAIVMQAIARPDGRDMSVTDLPFNWNAQLDIRKLRVGIIEESVHEITNAAAKTNTDAALALLASLGVNHLVPVKVPEGQTNIGGFSVESTVFFDEHARAGEMKTARGGARTNGRLVPAVEYLQSQRVRMMMMMKLADATAHVDAYIVGVEQHRGHRRAWRPRRRPWRRGRPAPKIVLKRRRSGTRTWPTWPAIRRSTCRTVSVRPAARPTSRFSPGRIGEMEILALAKAYQDVAGFHLQRPPKLRAGTA